MVDFKVIINKERIFVVKSVKGFVKKGLKDAAQYAMAHKGEIVQLSVMAAVVAMPNICGATELNNSTAMPWDTGLNSLVGQISGNIPKIAGVIAIAATAMMMFFGEMSGMAKKGIQVVIGISVALSAPAFVSILSGKTVSGCLF